VDPVLANIPEYEFEGEGALFMPRACDHGAVQAGTPESERADLLVDGDEGEDHLLPPHAILDETFNAIFDQRYAEPLELQVAANPPYEGLSVREVRRIAERRSYDVLNVLHDLEQAVNHAPDEMAFRRELYNYKAICLKIASEEYSIEKNVIDGNTKLAKGVGHGWKSEGISFLPNTMAGLGDLCPYQTKACTANCLNVSGRSEHGGTPAADIMNCRMRRTMLYVHLPDVFFMRVMVLLTKHAHDTGVDRYAFRPNVLSDIAWEKLKFYSPWARGMVTLIEGVPLKAPIQFYDYTKNAARYARFMEGVFPQNYHLTFSLSELNALYAFYALDHGGSVAVVFDTDPASYGRYPKPAKPLPESFCGYPVIDGDVTDLRFVDREMFGIPKGQGYVVGLRLKGHKHRERHFSLKAKGIEDGFIFDGTAQYDADTLIYESEKRRAEVEPVRRARNLKGDARRDFFAGFVGSMDRMLTQWWKGR